jgi:hypothetical protein
MNFLKDPLKMTITEIEDEIESLNKYKSTNPYAARLVSDRLTRLCIRHQEIELSKMLLM